MSCTITIFSPLCTLCTIYATGKCVLYCAQNGSSILCTVVYDGLMMVYGGRHDTQSADTWASVTYGRFCLDDCIHSRQLPLLGYGCTLHCNSLLIKYTHYNVQFSVMLSTVHTILYFYYSQSAHCKVYCNSNTTCTVHTLYFTVIFLLIKDTLNSPVHFTVLYSTLLYFYNR